MTAIFIDLESVRFTRPGGRPRGSLAEHDARKPRFFRKRFLEKHIPRLGIYRLAGFVDFKRLPDRSLQVLTGCVTQVWLLISKFMARARKLSNPVREARVRTSD